MKRTPIFAAGSLALLLGFTATPSVHAQSLTEGFESLTVLQTPGSDWSFQNLSTANATGNIWGQGSADSTNSIGPAPFGTPTSYAVTNYTATGSTGSNATISNWMITPTLTYQNGSTITFYTRTATGAPYADRLQVLFSGNGTSTNVGTTPTSVGDFTKTLLTINPNLATGPTNYPDTWTQYSITLSGLSGPTSGRVAFRYFVTKGGVNGANSNIIGVDSLVIAPEPSQFAALAIGGLGLGMMALRARRRSVA